ncbi:MAG TPA: ABATE domain-containing protein [Actinocrinis sp.]|nr:ABATE domain-containing protein [Actinocrinis sp.]
MTSTAGTGEPLAIDFANTRRAARGVPVETLPDPAALAAWLADHLGVDLAGLLGARELESFVALRDAVRDLALAANDEQTDPPGALATVNDAAAAAPTWPELVDGIAVERTEAAAVDAALATLARSAITVFGGPDRGEVRACGRRPKCVKFFVKNHPRRDYCSPACANRARVSRHHERHKGEA